MITYSKAEKEAAKQARKEFAKRSTKESKEKVREEVILSGQFPNESVLPDNYPMYAGRYYVLENESFKVVNAEESLTVGDYKNYLKLKGVSVVNIRLCNMLERNMF